jgi:hypothetical protein
MTRAAITSTTRRRTGAAPRWLVGVILIVHGLIHVLGPLDVWGIKEVEELSGRPIIDLGAMGTDLLAAVWLIALVLLVGAGIGVLAGRIWWRTPALAGVIVSQSVIVLWWDQAAAGTIPNLLVVAALVFTARLGLPSR